MSRRAFLANLAAAWFILVFHCTSPRMIGWAVAHPGDILRHVYIEISFLPPWLSLLSWSLSTALGMVAIVVAFGLVRFRLWARVVLLYLLPALYVVDVLAVVKGARMDASTPSAVVLILVAGNIVGIAAPYAAILWFYSRRKTRDVLFPSTAASEDSVAGPPNPGIERSSDD